MPRQIAQCGSCAAPIYDADGIAGACACDEGVYITLLARRRYENERHGSRTASTAPRVEPLRELDPMLFLSPAARQEVEAARMISTRAVPMPSPGRERPSVEEPSFVEGLDEPPMSFGDDISFDTSDLDVDDVPRYPTHGRVVERFRVDRPPPLRPFVAERLPGPQGGPMREAGQVGRFTLMREVDASPAYESTQVVRETGPERPSRDRQEAAKLNAAQHAKRAALHATLPTAYERVASDFLSDVDDFG